MIEPGQVWRAKLPGVQGEMVVVVVGPEDDGFNECAVVHTTLSMPYGVGHVGRWPLGNNDCWTRLT